MAEDLKDKAICVVLSGTGTDGALGAKAVKSELGMVMVQDPNTAKYDGMPRAAVAMGIADFVLPPDKMAGKLIEYVKSSYGKPAEKRRTEIEKGSTYLQQIFALLRQRTKHDFSGYKVSTVRRRIERRMGVNQIDKIGDYVALLKENHREAEALFKDFLINVTSFFRDPEAFDALKASFCKVLDGKQEGSIVRAWAIGCSTGEEAYSLAILIQECMEQIGRYFDIQVFGTDIDPDAINAARAGVYAASIAEDVSEERLKKYFVRRDSQYQIKKEIREKLIFAVQDFTTDPPFSRMDLISTRNVLIYLDADMQKRLMPVLHYALNENGILFLGTAESVGEFTDLFGVADRKWKIYQRRERQGETRLTITPQAPWGDARLPVDRIGVNQAAQRQAEQALLEALPPAVLVDRAMNIVFVHGQTGKYLELSQGEPRPNVLDMARQGLRTELSAAIREATAENRETAKEGARVKVNGGTQRVRITVRPVTETPEGRDNLVVTFEEMPEPKEKKTRKGAPAEGAAEVRYRELEQELQFTKETLRSTIEELETANEELRSANEEYQSTNEELQSTNEELETSREELQSVNEELMTMNTQYQSKIEELSTINDDMKNLLNSTDTATVFLDTDLKVKRYTPAATSLFNLIEADTGRPLEHVTSKLTDEKITEKAKRVLDTLIPARDNVQSRDGRWYSMRIHPYRTADNNIAGVVLSFFDITDEMALREAAKSVDYLKGIVDTVREPLVALGSDLRVVSANHRFYESFKVRREDTEGKLIYELGDRQWDIPALRKLLQEILTKNSSFDDYMVKHDFPGIGQRRMLLNARHLPDGGGASGKILLAIEDVTGK